MQIIVVQYSYGVHVKKALRNKLFSDSQHICLGSSGICHETPKTNSVYISNEAPAINREPLAGHLALQNNSKSYTHVPLSSTVARKRKWRIINDAFVLDLLTPRQINCLLKYLLFSFLVMSFP